jgi:hypothetical protein
MRLWEAAPNLALIAALGATILSGCAIKQPPNYIQGDVRCVNGPVVGV